MDQYPFVLPLEEVLHRHASPRFGGRTIAQGDTLLHPSGAKPQSRLEALAHSGILPPATVVSDQIIMHDTDVLFSSATTGSMRRYIATRSLTFRDGQVIRDKPDNTAPIIGQQITVLSGLCLFGGTYLRGVNHATGRSYPLSDLLIRATTSDTTTPFVDHLITTDHLHPYEMEMLLRLLPVINLIGPAKDIRLQFHLPVLEYWLSALHLFQRVSALHLFQRGCMCRDVVEQVFDAVTHRADRLARIIQGRLGCEIKFVEPLASIRDHLAASPEVSIDGLLQALEHDPLWQRILTINRPGDHYALSMLSYVYAYLAAAEARGTLVAVEDPLEMRILYETRKLMKGVLTSPAAMIGLYVHPMVVASTALGCTVSQSRLYGLDCPILTLAHQRSLLRQLTAIYEGPTGIVSSTGRAGEEVAA